MPSHTAAHALVDLYCSLDGAPWNWAAWRERTGVSHGLFPADDKDLPTGWTRQNATDVKTYFDAYGELPNVDKKRDFSTRSKGGIQYPGREVWHSFVSRHWNRWGVHSAVVEELKEWDIHPLAILSREPSLDGVWPNSSQYIPKLLDTLGMKLFGDEAFPANSETLGIEARTYLQPFAQRSWNSLRAQVNRLKTRRHEIEAQALATFKGDDLFFLFGF